MVTCVFCALSRPASEEDVIPKWVRRALRLTSGVIIRAEPTGATARTQHLVVTLSDMVCQECNNTWMSRLENVVKGFVKPLLTNKRGADVDEAQRDLARWAVMKVLLMEHSMRQRRTHLRSQVGYTPAELELAWLYAHNDPPPRPRVWLGAFDARGRFAITTRARLLRSAPPPSGGNPVLAHMTTLTIGYILFQVFTTNFVLADAQSLPRYDANPPRPYAQALVRIWPLERAHVKWPPSAYVAPDILDEVVNWGQPTST